MIPALTDNVLPEGLHGCTIEEVEKAFGQQTAARVRLTERLRDLLQNARLSGLVAAVVVNGSYVTGKDNPSDIDLIIVLRPGHDYSAELRPIEYNLLSRSAARRFYKFDIFSAEDGSEEYQGLVGFFSRVKADCPGLTTSREKKGLLRIEL